MHSTAICLLAVGLFFMGFTGKKDQNGKLVVKTTSGDVSGQVEDGIHSFKGIPYAKAERFMPPQPADIWKGILECNRFGPVAMQINNSNPDSVMDEKELFRVNVWTPGVNDGKKRPVMLWLHGGGFAVGAGDDPVTDGKSLAKKGDLVVVSVNHRLNILGFLDLSAVGEKYARSANVGMLDIVESLNWINKNIANFGGDPGNVTIFGESGGGGKVATLMCMPPAKGLFHKAIIMSGTLINVMTRDKSQAVGIELLNRLGITKNEVNKLDTIPYKVLVAAGDSALAKTVGLRKPGTGIFFGFGPVPDGKDLLQQPFTPGFADISNNVPLLIGTTFNELIRTSYADKTLTMEQAKERLKIAYGDKTEKYMELFAKTYPGYSPQDLLSIDTVFRPNTIMVADAKGALKQAPVYTYLLAWKSPVNNNTKGSFHGLDIPLAFKNIELGKHMTGDGSEARELAEEMSSAWINFAKTGKPGTNDEWKAYTRENGITMIFDSRSRIVKNHDRALMNLIKPGK